MLLVGEAGGAGMPEKRGGERAKKVNNKRRLAANQPEAPKERATGRSEARATVIFLTDAP